jgi:hypothetical protein
MPQEIFSIAIYEPLPGKSEDSLATMRELLAALSSGGYSRDQLYQDGEQFVLLRYWKSEESRRTAQEDPAIQRCWAKLAHEIRIVKVYERLEEALPAV